VGPIERWRLPVITTTTKPAIVDAFSLFFSCELNLKKLFAIGSQLKPGFAGG
jgi:hypothetical protein